MTDRELMQMALDALEWCYDVTEWPANGESAQDKAIEALRARLAQPEPEPVAWMEIESYLDDDNLWNTRKVLRDYDNGIGVPLYTAPPQREWQKLTNEEIRESYYSHPVVQQWGFARAIEAKLKEKNT